MSIIPMPTDLQEPVLTDNAKTVLDRRYLIKDKDGKIIETYKELFWRVASHVAAHNKEAKDITSGDISIAKEFYNLMANGIFLPNSPTLMNAGKPNGQLSACFVLPVEDNIEGIYTAIKNAALIHKSGGGTGFSFSRLRPEASIVGSTGGVASGPVSFLKIFDCSTEQIKQGGTRRGANMGILRIDHPDILKFIYAKEQDGTINNFNLSVAITDKFMDALENNTTYDLIDPHTNDVVGTYDANDIFNQLVAKAWKTGDPGVIFIDEVNRHNTLPGIGEIEATNPCVTGDTWVMTSTGPRQVEQLINKQFEAMIDGSLYLSTEKGFFFSGEKEVVELEFDNGIKLKLTPDHKVATIREDGIEEWVTAADLTPTHNIRLHNHETNSGWDNKSGQYADEHLQYGYNEGYLIGLLLGDGTFSENNAVLSIWDTNNSSCGIRKEALRCIMESRFIIHRSDFNGWQHIKQNEYRLKLASITNIARNLGIYQSNKIITLQIEETTSSFYKGVLRGLFDTDGSVQGSAYKGMSIRLNQSNLELLCAVQRMLYKLGIESKIYKNRKPASNKLMPDGKGGYKKYHTKTNHELIINRSNAIKFMKYIGLSNTVYQQKYIDIISQFTKPPYMYDSFLTKLSNRTSVGVEKVYDCTIPGPHRFDANGVHVKNCGEQPLLSYESCNLGSINLGKFVKGNEFDFVYLEEVVRKAILFLDNVIDVNCYPLKEIEEMSKGNRKIGLGIMGFADMLFKINVPYDSEEGLNTARTIMKFIDVIAKDESSNLANSRGVFPNHDKAIDSVKQLRHAGITTIAPTGTLSIIANCSSGMEPVFALSFCRNVMDSDKLYETNYVLQELLESRLSSKEEVNEVLNSIVNNGGSLIGIDLPKELEDIRNIYVTAMDISPMDHLLMQAAFQEHVDSAISKTINLPNSANYNDIREIYINAYKLKCKGVTVYRDGSKMHQVLTTKKTSDTSVETPTPIVYPEVKVRPRPDLLRGFTEKIRTGMGMLYLTVNEFEDKPFEVFATIGKSGKSVTAKTEAISRLISLALRSGISVEDVVNQLEGIIGEQPIFGKDHLVKSIPDAIAKILTKHYLSKTNIKVDNDITKPKCPSCSSDLIFEEGCHICKSCGYSKCS